VNFLPFQEQFDNRITGKFLHLTRDELEEFQESVDARYEQVESLCSLGFHPYKENLLTGKEVRIYLKHYQQENSHETGYSDA
jgi:hypothetical protein